MYTLYKIVDGEKQLLARFDKFDQAGEAADIYRSTFGDNSELSIEREA